MSFPTLDLPGVKLRSLMRPTYFDDVETQTPGFTAQAIATNTSTVYAQMRKRYGGQLPWGQSPPALVPAGVTPPPVVLEGRPTLGSLLMSIEITTPGPLGTALFRWSQDGGATWVATGVATAASVQLGTTGMVAVFPIGNYDTSNAYRAAPPVPETILRWVTDMTTLDVAIRHGIRSEDPLYVALKDRYDLTVKRCEEAANSKDGLWDLPVSEDLGSAVDTGGPKSYSETSPYSWTYAQAIGARRERGGGGGGCPPNSLVGG